MCATASRAGAPLNYVGESNSLTVYKTAFARMTCRCVCLALLLMCACCERPESVAKLELAQPVPRAENVLRVAVPRAAFGLIQHLAQNYMDAHRGRVVLVEDPLASDGPELALKNGMVDAAVSLFTGSQTSSQTVAQTRLVLALGANTSRRAFDAASLRKLLAGEEQSKSNRLSYVGLSRHDQLTALLGGLYPSLNILQFSRRSAYQYHHGEDTMAIARRTGLSRRGACLALEGNLRLFGIPVWVGTLQDVDANVQFRFEYNQEHKGAQHFAAYLHSRDVQTSIADLGYRSGTW